VKLGVLDLVPVFEHANAVQALEQAVSLARLAERRGYTRYWVAEHHDMPQLACTSPEVLLAHIGAKTERIRLGSGALLLPHYKPLKVAESFHLLASLYPGRIDLGIGRAPGGSAHASIALSGNFLENVRQLPTSLKELRQLLQGEFECEGQPVRARPIPPVPPELWLLGTNHKSAAYAAELGAGYVFGKFMSDVSGEEVLRAYRDAFIPSALCPEPRTIVAVSAICAETEEEAHQLAESIRRPGYDDESPEDRERKLLIGAPQQIRDRLAQMSAQYQTDEFMLVTMIPDYELRLRSFELLAPQ